MFDLYKTAILKSFQGNFEKYKGKRIVIYGTGDIAEFIMEEFSDYNIIGFLDGKRDSGTAFGKKVFSYEEAVKHKPDVIIVAAKKNNMRVIYDRICDMCYTNEIPVYAIDGRNLFTAFGYVGITAEQEKYGEINELTLRAEIHKHDVISFDIFDVLVMRKTLVKADVIDIVEDRLLKKGIYIPGYKEMRQKAEEEVVKQCGTIYDIYKKLARYTGIVEEISKRALEMELEIENSVLCSRAKMKELLLFALQKGKQVYLLADSYFPRDIMEGILRKHEITQYKNIFLSCEYRKTKEQGLYSIFKNETSGEAYLHIGADAEKDVVCAEKNHIDTFVIPRAYDMFCTSSYLNLLYSLGSVNERSMAGMLIARVFNNPFSLYRAGGRPEIDRIYDFGYAFIAPLLTKYVLWIIEEVKKGQYEDVLFAARDGFITHRLYDFVIRELDVKLPKGIYFQTSRNMCIFSSINDEDDIKWIAEMPYDQNPGLMLKMRFNIDTIDETIHSDAAAYALQFKNEILEKSSTVKKNYIKYMEKVGLKVNGKYAFVDFVSRGSCQVLLNKFIPFEIEGLYFGRYLTGNDTISMFPSRSLFENLMGEYVYCSYAYENYLFLETIMTSLKPSLASMDENGEPVFGREDRSEEELQYVKDIHSAIEDYFHDFIKNMYINDSEINKYFVDTIFSYREQKYTNEHCRIFDHLSLFDDLRQGDIVFHRK